MEKKLENLTQERVKKLIKYDPETGSFIRIRSSITPLIGKPCGWNYNGYRYIKIDGRDYKAHRLAFLIMNGEFPNGFIDHINGHRSDNRWENLREVSAQENAMNQRVYRNNTSGVMGVKYKKATGRWEVYIGSKPRKYLGSSKDWFEAVCIRKSGEIKNGYCTNHGNFKLKEKNQ